MLAKRIVLALIAVVLVVIPGGVRSEAQGLPRPAPAPGSPDQHIFYGAAVPGAGAKAPVIVFVHGLSGVAHDWWVGNDMYDLAAGAGFRTAFVSLSLDNTRNSDAIAPNAAVLKDALPKIAAHFGVPQFYIVAHSKGGVDLQAALMDPGITPLAKAVFTIATPNSGTELADWAFGPGRDLAEQLDALLPGVLLSPALFSLRTQSMQDFRANADPYFATAGVPFYTTAGDTSTGNPLLVITGQILKQLTNDDLNDGLVPVGRTHLPSGYAVDLGNAPAHHFGMIQGSVSFWKIVAEIQGLERAHGFERVATDGFGDPDNSWPWFMKWFQGKLYVGTGRAVNCVTFATSLVQTGQPVYPPSVGDCPPDFRDLSLAAEIWRFTPETGRWERVFKSPEDIPIAGTPLRFTARDIGFRGAVIFHETSGQDALYVSGVSASSLFENFPPYSTSPQGYPPPRILRSVDGVNWSPLPQAPGTFLGDIVKNSTDVFKVRGFRTMEVLNGQLFVTMTDYRGVGVVIGSANPSEGNDAWRRVSPPVELLPVWTVRAFNGELYAGTGDRRNNVGYGVWRSNVQGTVPTWIPVITEGGYQPLQPLRSPNVLNMLVYKGSLYVGTDRPTELLRVHADDTWDLLVGAPRVTPHGLKQPLSSITTYFGNTFNGHFWNLGVHDGCLYLGTWDWSVLLQSFGLIGEPFRAANGFDLFKTNDGENWSIVTNTGFNDPWNYGVRSLESTPYGFFIGAAKPQDGLQIWRNNEFLDLDDDGDIDQNDVDLVIQAAGEASTGPHDPRDMDRNGTISAADATKLATQCTKPGCEVLEGRGPKLAAPLVRSVSRAAIGENVLLYWNPVPGAVRYRIYEQPVKNLLDFIPAGFSITIPFLNITVTLQDVLDGKLDFLCEGGDSDLCALIDTLKGIDTLSPIGFPDITRPVAITKATEYRASPGGQLAATAEGSHVFQSIYFVRAEDAAGNLSEPSNIVGGPSDGPLLPEQVEPPTITALVSPSPNIAGWNNTPVTITWLLSGATTAVGCAPVTLSNGTAGTPLTCTAANVLGRSTSRSVTIKIDLTAPIINGGRAPEANAAGWNNADVTVTFACTDALSGIAECAAPEGVMTEGANQSRTGTATDIAGNVAHATVAGINLDKTRPQITGARAPLANEFGWNNTNVTVAFGCSDALSGISQCAPTPQVVSAEGANQSRTATAMDKAGNTANATVSGINIDKTTPVVSAAADPPPNANGWNNTDVTLTFAAIDNLSGVLTLTSPVTFSAEGAGQEARGIATDRAGNVSGPLVVVVNIDKTAPEAYERFDPASLDIKLFGRDGLSGVPQGPIAPSSMVQVRWSTGRFDDEDDDDDDEESEQEDRRGGQRLNASQRTFIVTDAAGNTLRVVDVVKKSGNQIQGRIESVAYNGKAPTTAPWNRLRLEWARDKKTNALRELEQRVTVRENSGQRSTLRAHFDAKKQRTVVQTTSSGEKGTVFPDLLLLRMASQRGKLVLEYLPF